MGQIIMDEGSLQLDLFLRGYKPALLLSDISPLCREKRGELIEKYPSIRLNERRVYLFFQNQSTRDKFMKDGVIFNNLGEPDSFDHRELGLTLGFPPKAVDFFVDESYKDEDYVKINYCGMVFICAEIDIKENLNWLEENIKVHKDYIFYIVDIKKIV